MIKNYWLEGIIHTFIGTGKPGYNGDVDLVSEAILNGPAGLAIDSNNNVYVAEVFNNVVRKIDTKTNIVTTIAGCVDQGFSGDGGLAGVRVDSEGNIYFIDFLNHIVRKITFKL